MGKWRRGGGRYSHLVLVAGGREGKRERKQQAFSPGNSGRNRKKGKGSHSYHLLFHVRGREKKRSGRGRREGGNRKPFRASHFLQTIVFLHRKRKKKKKEEKKAEEEKERRMLFASGAPR